MWIIKYCLKCILKIRNSGLQRKNALWSPIRSWSIFFTVILLFCFRISILFWSTAISARIPRTSFTLRKRHETPIVLKQPSPYTPDVQRGGYFRQQRIGGRPKKKSPDTGQGGCTTHMKRKQRKQRFLEWRCSWGKSSTYLHVFYFSLEFSFKHQCKDK